MKDYGVTTIESSKDGFHVEVKDARLNVSEHDAPAYARHACTYDELWTAARILNAQNEIVEFLHKVCRSQGSAHGIAISNFQREARTILAKVMEA